MSSISFLGKPVYSISDNGIFGFSIRSGIVTGIRYTENDPEYEISFGNNRWWSKTIFTDLSDVGSLMNLVPLSRVEETHGLKIKFDK